MVKMFRILKLNSCPTISENMVLEYPDHGTIRGTGMHSNIQEKIKQLYVK